MARKPITKITIEWEGWPWEQFGEDDQRKDEKEVYYLPSGFLQLLLGTIYRPYKDKNVRHIGENVQKSSITIAGYKATIEVIHR